MPRSTARSATYERELGVVEVGSQQASAMINSPGVCLFGFLCSMMRHVHHQSLAAPTTITRDAIVAVTRLYTRVGNTSQLKR